MIAKTKEEQSLITEISEIMAAKNHHKAEMMRLETLLAQKNKELFFLQNRDVSPGQKRVVVAPIRRLNNSQVKIIDKSKAQNTSATSRNIEGLPDLI